MATKEQLEAIAKECLAKGMDKEDVVCHVMLADASGENGHALQDEKLFGTLSKSPAKSARKLVADIKNENPPDEDYLQYKIFFDKHLSGARKDFISKQFLIQRDGLWEPAINMLGFLKSHGYGAGLKANRIEPHLERYIAEKKLGLLIDPPEWDGRDRIEELRLYVKFKGDDFSIFEDAIKEWLANVYRRIADNKAQNRCIILKGNQGMGKDRLIHSLLSGFGPYYDKFSSNRDERECWSQVTSKLVLHIEEFDQTGQLSVPFLKDLITRGEVTYRDPYGRSQKSRRCYGSFISSVNIDSILRDETGNRRFAVFEIESIDWGYPKDWSDQILAQAYALYKADYRAQKETWASVSQNNARFEVADIVPEMINLWDAKVYWNIDDHEKGVPYSKISDVVLEISRVSGAKAKTVLSWLKTNERSKRFGYGMRYFAQKPDEMTDHQKSNIHALKSRNNYPYKD